jgi:hypothetical protein
MRSGHVAAKAMMGAALSLIVSVGSAGCTTTGASEPRVAIANAGPVIKALPDPCALFPFIMARRFVPGLTVRDVSRAGYPRSNIQCNWTGRFIAGVGPERHLLIGLELFRGNSSQTPSYQAHWDLTYVRRPGSRPVRGLGNEAWFVYDVLANHSGYAEVSFRLGNAIGVIEYSGFASGGPDLSPVSSKIATATVMAVARMAGMELAGRARAPGTPG